MITPIQSNINFTGNLVLGTVKQEKNEFAAAKLLSTLPKEAQDVVLDEIKAFKQYIKTSTPKDDIFLLNLATDVTESGCYKRLNPPDGVPTSLGMEILYETPGINPVKNTLWGALSVVQAEFKTSDKKSSLKGSDLQLSVSSAFSKMKAQIEKQIKEVKKSPEFREEEQIRRILRIIG